MLFGDCLKLFVAAGFLMVLSCNAQPPSPYGMFQSCPEGCRPIDIATSCGSSGNLDECDMAVNGDVTISCRDGTAFGNGRFGCNSTYENYILARAKRCVRLVSRTYSDYRDYVAPVLLCIALFQVVGLKFERILMPLYAFTFEFFFGLMLMVVTDADDSLAVTLAAILAAAAAILCFFQGNIVGRVVVGLCLAFIIGIPALIISREGVGYTSLGVLCGLCVVAIVFAKWSKPASLLMLMCVTEFVIVSLGICAFLDGGSLFRTVEDAGHAALTFIVAGIAAVVVVPLNYRQYLQNEKDMIKWRMQHQREHLLHSAFAERSSPREHTATSMTPIRGGPPPPGVPASRAAVGTGGYSRLDAS
jgi:hypothetical protein